MTLTLDNFEQQIDPTILERGRRYAHDGRVLAVEEEGEKAWSARVEGTRLYTVSIAQTPAGGLSCLCTCPYDWGPTCKHIAAVLYTIEGSFPPTDNASPVHGKEDVQAETLRRLLIKQDKEELVDFLTELAGWDSQITNRILARYQNEGTSKQGYKRMVRRMLYRVQEQHGFIDYGGSIPAGQGVWELLRRARREAAAGRGETAASIYQAVIEVAASAIDNAVRSSGLLRDCIDAGLRSLSKYAKQLPPTVQRELFEDVLVKATQDRYASWEWDLAQLAADLVKTEEQREELYELLDEVAQSVPDDEYISDTYREHRYVQAETIKYSVVNRLDDDKACREFLGERVEIEPFREQLVHYHIERGNLQEARDLCSAWLEGRDPSQSEYWDTFQKLLLEIAQRENQEGEIIRLTEELFLRSGDFQYYDQLKERVPRKSWSEFRDRLIEQADQLPQYHLRPSEVFVREEMWAALLERVKQAHRGTVERYREHLEPRFPRELCGIYERIVWKIVEDKVHRKGYQEACRYLRRMVKLGQDDQARALIEALRSEYSNRPALLDELSRV